MRRAATLAMAAGIALLSGCSGMRQSNGTFVAHAEAIRLFGFPIPEDDQQAALEQVPAGATITSVNSTSADWTSLTGILGSLIGIHATRIGGTTK